MDTRFPHDLSELDPDESLRLLGSVEVARIALCHDGEPDVFPVNHLVHGGAVVFRSASGTKLGAAAGDATVAVQADHYARGDHTGWSVIAYGTAHIVTDQARLNELHALNFEPWAAPDRLDFWIEVVPQRISGRRILPT